MLADELLDPFLRHALRLCAEGVHEHRERVRDADRVRDLDLAAVGEPGGDDVLRHVARGVRRRAVDLRRVLAGERATAVRRGAAVGVDDDLAAGQAGVAHRAADHELPGRVDEDEVLVLETLLVVERVRQDRMEDVLDQVGLDQRLRVEPVAVLRRDEDALDLDRALAAVLVDLVADRDLRLAVGPQVREHVGLAHLGEPLADLVRELDRQRHQLVGLVRRVAEHHSLVAGADTVERVVVAVLGLEGIVDTLRDVGATARRSRR